MAKGKKTVEEVVITGSRYTDQPAVDNQAIIKLFGEYNNPDRVPGKDNKPLPDAANDPLPDAANDNEYLEEVKVKGVRIARAMLKRLLGALDFGELGMTQAQRDMVYDWIQESIEEMDREDADTQAGINDAIEETIEGIEEILVTAQPKPEYYPSKPMEEILITAPKIRKGSYVQTIEWPIEWIQSNQGRKEAPLEVPWPGTRETPESLPEPQPERAPNRAPEPAPQESPAPARNPLPGEDQYPGGKINLTLDPQTGIKLQKELRPNQRWEENRLRQDRKTQNASKLMRAFNKFFTKTYGTYSEARDLYEVIEWNIYIDGRPLAQHESAVSAIQDAARSENWYVDWEQLAKDYAMMEVTDRVIGKVGQLKGDYMPTTGWWSTNPVNTIPL